MAVFDQWYSKRIWGSITFCELREKFQNPNSWRWNNSRPSIGISQFHMQCTFALGLINTLKNENQSSLNIFNKKISKMINLNNCILSMKSGKKSNQNWPGIKYALDILTTREEGVNQVWKLFTISLYLLIIVLC